jgi:hypothetical protein
MLGSDLWFVSFCEVCTLANRERAISGRHRQRIAPRRQLKVDYASRLKFVAGLNPRSGGDQTVGAGFSSACAGSLSRHDCTVGRSGNGTAQASVCSSMTCVQIRLVWRIVLTQKC